MFHIYKQLDVFVVIFRRKALISQVVILDTTTRGLKKSLKKYVLLLVTLIYLPFISKILICRLAYNAYVICSENVIVKEVFSLSKCGYLQNMVFNWQKL